MSELTSSSRHRFIPEALTPNPEKCRLAVAAWLFFCVTLGLPMPDIPVWMAMLETTADPEALTRENSPLSGSVPEQIQTRLSQLADRIIRDAGFLLEEFHFNPKLLSLHHAMIMFSALRLSSADVKLALHAFLVFMRERRTYPSLSEFVTLFEKFKAMEQNPTTFWKEQDDNTPPPNLGDMRTKKLRSGQKTDCNICLQPTEEQPLVECNKACQGRFHGECLRQALLEKKKCPVCRRKVKVIVPPVTRSATRRHKKDVEKRKRMMKEQKKKG